MNNKAYSLIEMLIAVVLVMIIIGSGYKILTNQSTLQKTSVQLQQQSSSTMRTLDTFKKDASLIDDTWTQNKVSFVYPHPGLAFHQNYHTDVLNQAQGLHDGVTFLHRDPHNSILYGLDTNATFPASFGKTLTLKQPATFVAKDTLLLFGEEQTILGTVVSVNGTTFKIKPYTLNQKTSNGYVIASGTLSLTTATLTKGKAYAQVVEAVSYELDYATTDFQPAGLGNAHLLNPQGNPLKAIVRTSKGIRSYVSLANQLNFTSPADLSSLTMNLDQNSTTVAFNQLHEKTKTQTPGNGLANNSNNSGLSSWTRNGQPLYLASSNHPVDIVIPYSPTYHAYNIEGSLALLNEDGTSVPMFNASQTAMANQVNFKFTDYTDPNHANYGFMPTTLVQQQGIATNKIYIGGMTAEYDNGDARSTPAMVTIEYPAGMSFREFVSTHSKPFTQPFNQGCSLDQGCTMKKITVNDIKGSPDRLKDTSHISVDPQSGEVFVASLTRSKGQDSNLSIYQTDSNLNTFTERVIDTSGIFKNKVISSIGQNPIVINETRYLPIALSRSIQKDVVPTNDGEILLYNLDKSAPLIKIANHNFKVNGMTSMEGSLLIQGKLVTQVMNSKELSGLVEGTLTSIPTLYTDEIADASGPIYADGFYSDSKEYQSPSSSPYQSVFQWGTGISVLQTAPLTYSLIMGNNQQTFDYNQPYLEGNFTTLNLKLGGTNARVMASIDTDFNHLEASRVVVNFEQSSAIIPTVLLPGVLYGNSTPRNHVASLPSLSSNMSDSDWYAFYTNFVENNPINPDTGSYTYLPDPAYINLTCTPSIPKTC